MSDAPTNLPAVSAASLAALIDNDSTIKRYLRAIETEKHIIKKCRQRIAIANGAIRNQKNFLKRQNGDFVRELSGIQAVPGMLPKRESASQAQKRIKREYQAALRTAQAELEAANPPAPEAPPTE